MKNGLSNKFLGRIKNVNYETKNIDGFKQNVSKEIHGAIGFLSELELIKEFKNKFKSLLTPKLLRYAPGNMKKRILVQNLLLTVHFL